MNSDLMSLPGFFEVSEMYEYELERFVEKYR